MAHLLIVDDDPSTLASLARAFRLAGHEATVCDNAARALELAKSQAFDMMLSDVVMPGKDGLALLEDLRALGITLPVVMISGQANIEMAVRATRLELAKSQAFDMMLSDVVMPGKDGLALLEDLRAL